MTNRKVMLEFSEFDLPLLAEALRTAACTAMMTGNPQAQKRLDTYRAALDALIPKAARMFDGACWSEICMALADSRTYSVEFERWGWDHTTGDKYGSIYITVGNSRWRSHDYRNYPGRGDVDAVKSLLQEIAPLDAVRIEVEDTLARHLMPQPPSAPMPEPNDRYYEDDPGFGPKICP